MIQKVNQDNLYYTCNNCKASLTVALQDIDVKRKRQGAFLPPCSSCKSIQYLDLRDPLHYTYDNKKHPGYNSTGIYTPYIKELIHGQACLAALSGRDPKVIYRNYNLKEEK